MTEEKIDEIKQFIGEHVEDKLSIEEIAKHFGYSVNHLRQEFKNFENETIGHFVLAKKFERAKKLLEDGGSCEEIARRIGYESSTSFRREFKKFYKVKPSEISGGKEKQKPVPERKYGEGCKGCVHWRPLDNISRQLMACHYIIDTGEPRNCDAGKDCLHYDSDSNLKAEIRKKSKRLQEVMPVI